MGQNNRGIEIIGRSAKRELAPVSGGIEIRRQGKPVSGRIDVEAFAFVLIDCSRSMGGKKLEQARKGALNFARDAMSKGYLTGLIQFNNQAKLLCEPQQDFSALEKGLKSLTTGGTTRIAEAISLAHSALSRKAGSRTIVLVTDGKPNGPDDPQASLNAAEASRNAGINIIAIGTDDADQAFLSQVASKKEQGIKVSISDLGKAITSSAYLLPMPTELKIK
jgi:Mg-chelatase subunit ChlD